MNIREDFNKALSEIIETQKLAATTTREERIEIAIDKLCAALDDLQNGISKAVDKYIEEIKARNVEVNNDEQFTKRSETLRR